MRRPEQLLLFAKCSPLVYPPHAFWELVWRNEYVIGQLRESLEAISHAFAAIVLRDVGKLFPGPSFGSYGHSMAEPIDASAMRAIDVIFIVGITGGNLTDSHEIGVGTHKDDVARAHLVTKFPIPKSRLGGYGVSVRSNAFRLQGLNDFVLIRKSRNIPKWWGH